MRDDRFRGRSPTLSTSHINAMLPFGRRARGPAPRLAAVTIAALSILALAACRHASDPDAPDPLTDKCGSVTAVHPLPGKGAISVEIQNPQPDVSYILQIQDPATLNVVGQAGPNGNPVVFTGMPSGTFPAIWLVSGCGPNGDDANAGQDQIPGPINVTVP